MKKKRPTLTKLKKMLNEQTKDTQWEVAYWLMEYVTNDITEPDVYLNKAEYLLTAMPIGERVENLKRLGLSFTMKMDSSYTQLEYIFTDTNTQNGVTANLGLEHLDLKTALHYRQNIFPSLSKH